MSSIYYSSRISPESRPSAQTVFTRLELKLLDKLKGPPNPDSQPCLGHYLLKLAQLGGYLARASDPPPGNKIFWRGLTRLTNIHLGYLLAKKMWVIECYGGRFAKTKAHDALRIFVRSKGNPVRLLRSAGRTYIAC